MIENRFLYFDTKAQFLEKAGLNYNVPNQLIYNEIFGDSIVVIKETNEIWTHGVFFQGTDNTVKLKNTYNITNSSYDIGMSLTFTNINSGKVEISSFNAKYISSGTLNAERLPMIPLDKLPHGALERLYIVADEAAALSNEEITEGDSIKRIDTNMMYFCVKNTGTFSQRFVEYTAGGSSSIDWGNILNKPDFSTVATTGSYNDLLDKPDLVNLLPSNLITGSGNTNCLAKFTSNNNIISGPRFINNSTSNLFLSERGNWENPINVLSNIIKVPIQGSNDLGGENSIEVTIPKKSAYSSNYIMICSVSNLEGIDVIADMVITIGLFNNSPQWNDNNFYLVYNKSGTVTLNIKRKSDNIVEFSTVTTGITHTTNANVTISCLIPIN